MTKRAPLSSELSTIRPILAELVPLLAQKPEWYVSVFFEKKSSTRCSATFKNTNVSNTFSMGAVLRIYDGYTLFEQGTDDLSAASLKETAKNFAARVASTQAPLAAVKRPYNAPSWNERLGSELDVELISQIPSNLNPQSPVHFGIAYEIDPKSNNGPDIVIKKLSTLLNRCLELAPETGMSKDELTYIGIHQEFRDEESIFIDREVNMSQTLYRNSLRLVCMADAESTHLSWGGLGGLESVEPVEHEIIDSLKDLKALKSADKLQPGRYTVLMGPVVAGVVAHEAFGHSQEADTCARERSKAWELHKTGELVGNQHATILNNPAIYKNGTTNSAAWGSYFFDQEGWLAQSQTILDCGKLSTPMTNLTSALRLQIPRTANGKRESWTHGVYSRQTNTYFSAGDKTLQQLMDKVQDGFLATEVAGGMEDPKGMGIQVGLQYLKEVKNGKLTGRVLRGPAGGDIQMTGYVPDVLNSIIDKSKIDYSSDKADTVKHPYNDLGGCGKYHKEFVVAGCGGPYMLLENVILG